MHPIAHNPALGNNGRKSATQVDRVGRGHFTSNPRHMARTSGGETSGDRAQVQHLQERSGPEVKTGDMSLHRPHTTTDTVSYRHRIHGSQEDRIGGDTSFFTHRTGSIVRSPQDDVWRVAPPRGWCAEDCLHKPGAPAPLNEGLPRGNGEKNVPLRHSAKERDPLGAYPRRNSSSPVSPSGTGAFTMIYEHWVSGTAPICSGFAG